MEGESRRIQRTIPKRFTRPEILRGMQAAFDAFRAAGNKETARKEFVAQMLDSVKRYLSDTDEGDGMRDAVEEMDAMLRAEDARFPEYAADRIADAFKRVYQNPASAEAFGAKLREIERSERRRMIRDTNGTSLSPESVLYGNIGDDGAFHLHVADAYTLGPAEKLRDLRAGLRELARLMEHDPAYASVQRVEGTSWIVGEHPELVARLGFHVAGADLTEEEKALHFAGDTRRIRGSWMSRDELIGQYGEKAS